MGAFKAGYGGRCAACPERIEPGDEVVFVDDELIHVECEDQAISASGRRRAAEVCAECWIEKPCACDDGQGPES